jgi:hypothetical protein
MHRAVCIVRTGDCWAAAILRNASPPALMESGADHAAATIWRHSMYLRKTNNLSIMVLLQRGDK